MSRFTPGKRARPPSVRGRSQALSDVVAFGLRLTRLGEHRELEWKFFDWMVPTDGGGYVLPERPERLPLVYTLEAIKQR